MLPPGMYAACVQTLRKVAQSTQPGQILELHFADEEGDPYAVELAARLGGYVVGKDSDFVILNADGYRGYVPLDLMVWTTLSDEDEYADEAENDGFQTVVNSKSKKRATSQTSFNSARGIIPPDDTDIQLSVVTYSPGDLAQHLQLPLSLLPLLGALVGNDFTGDKDPSSTTTAQKTNLQWLFFEHSLSLTQRITRVASTLRMILNAALTPGKNKQRHAVHSVMELIERAVSALIVRSLDSMASGEKERVVERVVEATLQYAIPRYDGLLQGREGLWADGVCALHDIHSCPLLRYISHQAEEPPQSEKIVEHKERIRAQYIASYRAGRLDPHTLDPLHTSTFWYRQFLENPDFESVARSIGQPIQLWIYALLDDALGLPVRSEGQEEQAEGMQEAGEEDEDELIDVVEESDEEDVDPLAPLRGALQQLGGSDEGTLDDQTSEISPSAPSASAIRKVQPKIITEYVRRGTRLAAEDVVVISLGDLNPKESNGDIPIQLQPATARLALLLQALESDTRLIHSLPSEQRVPALVVRWIAYQLHRRAQEHTGDKIREKDRWTKQEVRALLASFCFSSPDTEIESPMEAVPIVDRNVQLVAQVSVALDCIIRLSEVLSLDEELPNPVLRFSGRRFHAYLTRSMSIQSDNVPDRLWHACMEEIEHVYAEAPGKKKREKREVARTISPVQAGRNPKSSGGSGRFGLLADADA
jgi:hypothetical protein